MKKRRAPVRRLVTAKARAAELERSGQRAYRERLQRRARELREQIRALKRDEKRALVQVKDLCRRSRARARARAKSRRVEVLEALRAETARLYAEARRACEERAGRVKRRGARARAGIEKQALELAREMASDRLYREHLAGGPRKGRARSTKRERQHESDDEVRQNLDPELVPVFDQVRHSIQGTPKISRTEQFLHWAEENPDDVVTIRAELGDRAFQKELREHLAEQRRIARVLKKKKISAADLESMGLSAAEIAAAGLDPTMPDEVRLFLEGPEARSVELEEAPF